MDIEMESLQRLAFDALPVLLDAAVKGAVLLAVAGVLVLAMRKASAAARQVVWLLALGALVALPLASAALPSWGILPGWARIEMPAEPAPANVADSAIVEPRAGPVGGADLANMQAAPPAPHAHAGESESPPAPTVSLEPAPHAMPAPAAAASTAKPAAGQSWRMWIVPSAVAIWWAGSLVCLLPLVLGRISLWRLARRSRRIERGTWAMLLRRAAKAIGLRRPVVLLQSSDEPMPMVWGVLRPRLLLPAEAEDWSADRRWVVLLHELAHAKRHDCLAKLVAHVACALYWFNPLCWIAFKLMQRESEAACDDLVLSADHASTGLAGLRPSDYAQHLLEIASGLKSGMLAAYSSIAMARPSKLEGRLLAILDGCRNRRRLTIWGFLILALLTASIVIPVSLMKAPAKAGIASRSDYWLANAATFHGVRPDCGDDLYDAEGNPTGIKVECEPEQASWDQDTMMRDFILQLPASDELITPTGPVMISQPGQNDMLALAYPEVIAAPDGKQLVIVPASLPREVSKGGLLGGLFGGNEPLQSVDFTLRFFHGPRGKAEQTFAGPFVAGQKLQAGGITLEVKRRTQNVGSPGVEFAVSANRRLEFGMPLTVYDKSGKAHPSQYGGGSRGPDTSTLDFRLPKMPLEQIARIAFNEGSYFIVCRNVRVSYDQLPARSHAPYLDRIAERLGLPAEKALAISEKGFANPIDAVKCADLVRGESIRDAWRAIAFGEPRLKLSALTDEQKDALANVATKWATQSRKYRPVGVQLGLWCKRAEFVPLAIDLLKGDIDYSGRSEVARSIQAARDLLTDEQVDQLTRLVLEEEDPSVTTLQNVLMTLAQQGTNPAAERAVQELAESDKPWLWRPAVGWLAPREKLGDRSAMSRKMLLRAIAVTAARPGEEPLEAEARKMVGNELTPKFLVVDMSTFAEALRWYASRADKGDGTQCLLGMLRLLVNEWDTHKVEGRASSNWWAVDRSVKYLNLWHGVDIGGVGSDVTQETYSEHAFNWKAIAEQALRWSETGIDPGNLPAGWKPGDGDIRVVWKNLHDPAMSVIALPPAQEQALGAHLALALAKDMLNIRRTETDKLPGLETIAGVMQSHSTRKEFTLHSIPMQLPLGPYMGGSSNVDRNGVRHQTKLWVGSWELWVEPADAAEGCLADTELFAEWKAAYLIDGGTRAALARVFSHHDPASIKRFESVLDQSLQAPRNRTADLKAAAESVRTSAPATVPATQLASEAATTRPAATRPADFTHHSTPDFSIRRGSGDGPALEIISSRVSVSNDGLMVASYGARYHLINVATGNEIKCVNAPTDGYWCISPDGKMVASSRGIVVDTMTGRQIAQPGDGSLGAAAMGQFSSDGSTLALFTGEAVLIYDTKTWKRKQTLTGPTSHITCISAGTMSADGGTVVIRLGVRTAGSPPEWLSMTTSVYDVASGRKLLSSPRQSRCPTLSRDGKLVAIENEVIDVANGRTLLRGAASMRCAAISPAGDVVAVMVSGDTTVDERRIELWNVATGRLISKLACSDDLLNGLQFSSDAKLLIGHSDHVMPIGYIWQVASATPVAGDGTIGSQAAAQDPAGAASTQPVAQTSAGVLEFRIAPVHSAAFGGRQLQWYEEILRHGDVGFWYKKTERFIGRMPDHAWLLATRDFRGRSYITELYDRKTYMLVSDKPQERLVPGSGADRWRLLRVAVSEIDAQYRTTIDLELDQRGGELMAELTSRNLNKHLAVIVDGNVLSASVIKTTSNTHFQIAGVHREEAQAIVLLLREGIQSSATRPATRPVSTGPDAEKQTAIPELRVSEGYKLETLETYHKGEAVEVRLHGLRDERWQLDEKQMDKDVLAGKPPKAFWRLDGRDIPATMSFFGGTTNEVVGAKLSDGKHTLQYVVKRVPLVHPSLPGNKEVFDEVTSNVAAFVVLGPRDASSNRYEFGRTVEMEIQRGEFVNLATAQKIDSAVVAGRPPVKEPQFRMWLADNNVDLLYDSILSVKRWVQVALANALVSYVPSALANWDSLSADQAAEALTIGQTVSSHIIAQYEGQPQPDGRAWGPSRFKTRGGQMGLLQIVRMADDGTSVRVRWKLIQPRAAASQPGTQPANTAVIPPAPDAMGPALDAEAYIAASSDSKRLVVFHGNSARVLDAVTGKEVSRFGEVEDMPAISPDGRLVATSRGKILDAATGRQAAQTDLGNVGTVAQPRFSNDGRSLAFFTNKAVVIYDTTTWKRKRTLPGPADELAGATMSGDGSTVAMTLGVPSKNVKKPPEWWANQITVWDAGTGRNVLALSRTDYHPTLSNDGKLLAIGNEVVEVSTGKTLWKWTGQRGEKWTSNATLAISPAGDIVAVHPFEERCIELWSIRSGKLVGKLRGADPYLRSFCWFSGDGQLLLGSYGAVDERTCVWRVSSATQPAADAAEIDRLIKQLGSEKFADRDAAQKALVKIGLPAVEPLRRATGHSEPEIASRAKQALAEILPISITIRFQPGTVEYVNKRYPTLAAAEQAPTAPVDGMLPPDVLVTVENNRSERIDFSEKDFYLTSRILLDGNERRTHEGGFGGTMWPSLSPRESFTVRYRVPDGSWAQRHGMEFRWKLGDSTSNALKMTWEPNLALEPTILKSLSQVAEPSQVGAHLRALRFIGHRALVGGLKAVLGAKEGTYTPDAQSEAAYIARSDKVTELTPELTGLLKTDSDKVRAQVLMAFISLEQAPSLTVLALLAESNDPLCRECLAEVLGYADNKDSKAAALLHRMVASEDAKSGTREQHAYVKIWACGSLGRLKDRSGIPVLIEMLKDDQSETVRARAVATLRQVTDLRHTTEEVISQQLEVDVPQPAAATAPAEPTDVRAVVGKAGMPPAGQPATRPADAAEWHSAALKAELAKAQGEMQIPFLNPGGKTVQNLRMVTAAIKDYTAAFGKLPNSLEAFQLPVKFLRDGSGRPLVWSGRVATYGYAKGKGPTILVGMQAPVVSPFKNEGWWYAVIKTVDGEIQISGGTDLRELAAFEPANIVVKQDDTGDLVLELAPYDAPAWGVNDVENDVVVRRVTDDRLDVRVIGLTLPGRGRVFTANTVVEVKPGHKVLLDQAHGKRIYLERAAVPPATRPAGPSTESAPATQPALMNRATVNVSGGRVRIEDGNSVIEGKRITLEAGRVLVEGDAAVRAGGNTAKASRVDIRMAPATRPAGER